MADALNSIIPWILLGIGLIWVWSLFGDHIVKLYEWVKSLFSRPRFQAPIYNPMREFSYS